MSSKLLALLATSVVLIVVGVIGVFLWRHFDDRASHQEGFRQMMDRKVHGRDLFDGFTSDPSPGKRGK